MNELLKKLYDEDRKEHAIPKSMDSPCYTEMRERDAQRRDEVRKIFHEQNPSAPEDLYHAAWILNHGDQPEDAELAYRLAERAFELGYKPAGWLFAAAFDRWCMYSGRPQKFGTQIVPDGQRYRVWDTDPTTTNEERKRYDVPPISEMEKRAARDTNTLTQPPMERAPVWLVEAIERWRQVEGS